MCSVGARDDCLETGGLSCNCMMYMLDNLPLVRSVILLATIVVSLKWPVIVQYSRSQSASHSQSVVIDTELYDVSSMT